MNRSLLFIPLGIFVLMAVVFWIGLGQEDKTSLYHTIGLGALKYFILKVDPKKRILFDPESSVDFAGNTGPFIQYTYARIQSIIRKAAFDYSKSVTIELHEKEKELLKQLELLSNNFKAYLKYQKLPIRWLLIFLFFYLCTLLAL